MSTNRRVAPLNRLLAALPRRESQTLLACCEAVELKLGEVLYEPDARIRYVYFPTGSFISLIIPVDGIPTWRWDWSAMKGCSDRL
jgi:hypothetical protein